MTRGSLFKYTLKALQLFLITIFFSSSVLYAAENSPLTEKGMTRFGIQFGYGYSFKSNRDIRFASIYPYFGKTLSNPLGSGWYRGTVEAILEGAFSMVRKSQHTYSAGINCLVRYNFLPKSETLRPFIQGGFGLAVTNLVMDNFGSNFNFASNAGCGLQYFFNKRDAVTLEWRFIHLSNAGIDCKNSGLNMNNILIGFTRLF